MPYNRIGTGPPVLVIQGLTFENRALTGIDAWFMLRPYRQLARTHEVIVVNRRPGTPAGSTLSDLARDYAVMIEAELEPPVDVIGLSSGGSIAFFLASEHPTLIRRLVIQDAACRMSSEGVALMDRLARLAEAGDWTGASRILIGLVWPDNAVGRLATRLFAPLMARGAPGDPGDMVALIRAEGALDVCGQLGRIRAPTLVATGEADALNPPEAARATTDAIPGAQLRIYPRQHGVRGADFQRDLVAFLG
jgi:pimeloyl-ACP methyl ester carboxylesterase